MKPTFDIFSTYPVQKTTAVDAWRFGMMGAELWASATTTIMLRSSSLFFYWHNPNRRSTAEMKRMVDEKIAAVMEVNAAWLRLAFGIWSGGVNPWRSSRKLLAPVHHKAKANARRLARRKRL
jgi:hypothetical protein